ncbi:DUF3750 domain-containing protein [Thalassomonas actiniarum]|uniref:DUF3750 domain-containing protein n=1 Tax=Thalassomonas actiniarum TaxID=485447 RepID=A0AAE9YQ21_9GAMM|nr:DUF3750 domain-containing protein [Thalassomonas actiniarum]WDD97466.1 DUF3750 domain-containing protein [Thalassomonas actiniarum]
MKKLFRIILASIAVILFTGFLSSCSSNKAQTRGLFAPKPAEYTGAVIQVYAARTWGAKQAVSVHTWISTKRSGEQHYTSYEIIGWRLRRNNSALVVRQSLPDRDWWGHQPQLLLDYRAPDADQLIDKIAAAVADYPYKNEYQAYPGPNSNTFTASIARAVPELGLDLPSTAIGKDYSPITRLVGPSPSGSGYQFSLLGMLAVTVGVEEGLELNLLGLNFEFDIFDLAIELPGIGRIGVDQVSRDSLEQDNHTLAAQKAKNSATETGE